MKPQKSMFSALLWFRTPSLRGNCTILNAMPRISPSFRVARSAGRTCADRQDPPAPGQQILSRTSSGHRRRLCSIGAKKPGEQIVVTTDLSIEDRHFRLEWHPPEAVGCRTLARGLSDLAAMGARPLAAFLSLGLPPELTRPKARKAGQGNSSWMDRFLDGFFALARAHTANAARRRRPRPVESRRCRHCADRRLPARTCSAAFGSPRGRSPLCHRFTGWLIRRPQDTGKACGDTPQRGT